MQEHVRIAGVSFELSGMRKAEPYLGDLPHGILREDTLEVVRAKLLPMPLTREYGPATYQAWDADHRIVVQFKKNGELRSCWWMSVKERRREPAARPIA